MASKSQSPSAIKWRADNKERLQEYNRQWGKSNPEAKREAQRKAYQNNREKNLEYNLWWRRKRLYGIDKAWYDARMIAQEGACEICKKPFAHTPHVDHDHKTGTARALLCSGCNQHVGTLEHELYPKFVEYLNRCWESDGE